MSEPKYKLPGKVATVIQLIQNADEEESFFTTLPQSCEKIRKCLGGEEKFFNRRDGHGNMSRHGFIYLCPEKEKLGTDDFIQVQVETESNAVTLIVRKDNLYLIGFLSSRGYFELKSKEKEEDRLLPEATLLKNMDVNYQALLNIGADDVSEMYTKFNHQQLIVAVGALDTPDQPLKHHHLGVVTVMILEATRFPNIMKAIINRGRVSTNRLALNAMAEQIKNWDKASRILCNYRNEYEGAGETDTLFLEDFGTLVNAEKRLKVVHSCQERRLPAPPAVKKGSKPSKQSQGESSRSKKRR